VAEPPFEAAALPEYTLPIPGGCPFYPPFGGGATLLPPMI